MDHHLATYGIWLGLNIFFRKPEICEPGNLTDSEMTIIDSIPEEANPEEVNPQAVEPVVEPVVVSVEPAVEN